MKILLVDPPNHYLRKSDVSIQVHPLGLGYLAAVLAPDHDVEQLVCDLHGYGDAADKWRRIADAIDESAPDLVGITTVTATFPAALRVAGLVRERRGPDVPIVLGGVHPTFRPKEAFACDAVDFVVRGEGEATFAELVRAIASGADPRGLPGLLWRGDDGAVQMGPSRAPIEDLDSIPHPRRDGVLWSERIQPSFYQSIITVRGCPYKCIYCSVPNTSDRKTRYRSAGNIADEIASLKGRWDIPYLFFHDSVFTLNRKRTLALMDAMRERDLTVPFACQTRADRVDPELLQAMKAAGCHQIFFGIESGDVDTLVRMKKKMALQTVRDAVDAVKRLGIRCTGFFMVGFPWETRDHIERTAGFATDLGLDAISLFSATPLPGTELWDITTDRPIPESIDFRAPQMNLTSMPHDEYARLFEDVKARVDAYNEAQMMRHAAMEHWPRG